MITLFLKTRELLVFWGTIIFVLRGLVCRLSAYGFLGGFLSHPFIYLRSRRLGAVLNKFIKYKKPANLAFMRLAGCFEVVPKRGLEPLCLAAQVPETCVSTNFTTWADEKI